MAAIRTLLIANRGEIASRIMRTAQSRGIRCIAVFSEADRNAPFVTQADQAVCLGPAPAAESYLDIDKVIAAARATGADAVHPGYGFLSENTDFSARCEQAGILFVGPGADAIAAMGSKSAAKALMAKAKVPLVPGYHGDDQAMATLEAEAEKIGYPLLIKASAGGGGKGMRVVNEKSELKAGLEAAQREAKSSFGDARLLMERYLLKPRHVEVQVLFDQYGNGRHIFDRDCSIQRRHQKVVEEAPAPDLPDALRKEMGDAAVRCGEAIGYVGAGTVEFLVDADGSFYFMEMNTRLQVEHPVTEMVSGLDLVDWQLRIAEGEKIEWSQESLRSNGHAVEVRIYAEDPEGGFLPQTGTLHTLTEPVGLEMVRVDSGVAAGQEISAWYDPMLAKVIAWGENREAAIRRLSNALTWYRASGTKLNTGFLQRILNHPAFVAGELTTDFIQRHESEVMANAWSAEQQLALTWLAWYQARPQPDDNWAQLPGWRLGQGDHRQLCEIQLSETAHSVSYAVDGAGSARVWVDEQLIQLRWQGQGESTVVWLDGHRLQLANRMRFGLLTVFANAECWTARINQPEAQAHAQDHSGALNAPMHGRITDILCKGGDEVSAGTPLVIMEAMKMEHTIKAPVDGVVTAVLWDVGQTVEAAAPLVEFEAHEEAGNDG